jgi:hypothetical protein
LLSQSEEKEFNEFIPLQMDRTRIARPQKLKFGYMKAQNKMAQQAIGRPQEEKNKKSERKYCRNKEGKTILNRLRPSTSTKRIGC